LELHKEFALARIHGRRGQLYVGLANDTASAEAVANLNSWSINFESDKIDVTSFGDTTKTYVAGLPDAAGSFGGYFDSTTAQLYTAASDGLARRFYLYPTTPATAGPYWFGTAFFDFSIEGGVADAVTISGNWAAATSVSKVG
jgi:hypothetical protein